MINITAKNILGNPDYLALCYGGFREKSRDFAPSIEEVKEDMKLLSAMGIKVIRTYYSHKFPHSFRVLEAIKALKAENPTFEMYVMLGAWIECEGAYTKEQNHKKENIINNRAEIARAIELANQYQDIVKIIAVGNESMVHWAETYFVSPQIVLNYVIELQTLKEKGKLDTNLWITSSDNFASWGGGGQEYHTHQLTALYQAVDYVSMHTYPFHDTHYNPQFWLSDSTNSELTQLELTDIGMQKATDYAKNQFVAVKNYMKSLGINKPIHIGETGWSTSSNGKYGAEGSHASDEYKQKLYYNAMRGWTKEKRLSCFFFEAFDEPWKDLNDPRASENHFGLIDIEGKAKYVIWDLVDQGVFEGLNRDGNPITKTYNGKADAIFQHVLAPPFSYALSNH